MRRSPTEGGRRLLSLKFMKKIFLTLAGLLFTDVSIKRKYELRILKL
jgi:hypothetical protein